MYESSDEKSMIDLWNQKMGQDFPMDLRLWRQNTIGDAHFRPELSVVVEEHGALVAFCLVKLPGAEPAWHSQRLDTGYINSLVALQPKMAAAALLLAEEGVRAAGMQRIAYGSDPKHFFPGVPETHCAVAELLSTNGYRLSDSWSSDVYRDLDTYDIPERVVDSMRANPTALVRPCQPEDVPELAEFLQATFPGRWLHDTMHRIEVEPNPEDVMLLMDGGRVTGFAHIYHPGSTYLGPPIYWRGVMREPAGGLGPIGISADMRKRGLGLALLALSIERLRELGVKGAAIDWTDLLVFYGKLGFQPWRRYRHAVKELA